MTPATAIAMLDRQLAAHGSTVTLQRMNGAAIAEAVDVPAFMRGFEPQELVNGITQHDAKVILSPSGLAGWNSGGEDPIVPTVDNRFVAAGRTRRIIAAVGIRLGGQVVRIECAVR
jgi:hypothetical protein